MDTKKRTPRRWELLLVFVVMWLVISAACVSMAWIVAGGRLGSTRLLYCAATGFIFALPLSLGWWSEYKRERLRTGHGFWHNPWRLESPGQRKRVC